MSAPAIGLEIHGMDERCKLGTCGALTAMLQELLEGRTELELGEQAIYGMWIILEAQRRVLSQA